VHKLRGAKVVDVVLVCAQRKELESLRDVLSKMLVFEPANRMSAAAALRHPFFAEPADSKKAK